MRTPRAPLTALEASTLAALSLKLDPWRGLRWSTQSRSVSQAVQRLKRKGYLQGEAWTNQADMTPKGADALETTWRWYLAHGQQVTTCDSH